MKIVLILFSIVFSLSLFANSNSLKTLTKQEKQWISHLKHPIKIGVTTIPNQILKQPNGSYVGFSIDIFKLIEQKTSLPFEYVYFENWSNLIQAAKKHQIDVVFLAQKTQSRLSYLDFTDTVLKLQNKLIVSITNKKHNKSILTDKKIAVTKGSAIAEYIKEHYPNVTLKEVSSELEGLRMVATHTVDATITEPVRASYYIKKYNLKHLVVKDDFNYIYNLSIASRNDLSHLNIILSKAVNSISKKTLESYMLKWGYLEHEIMLFSMQTLIYLGIAFGIIIPFAFYLYLTNQKLQKETSAKEKAINQLNVLLKEREEIGEILRKRVLEEVEKNRKQELYMLHQNRLAQMGELINMIAHQWRQPLNNLSLINQLLVTKYNQNKLNDTAIEYFKTNSKKQIDLMSQTIDNFRNFYKLDNKKESANLYELIQKAVDMIRPVFEKENIQVKIDADKELVFYGHIHNISQAILNIINNAKDAIIEKQPTDKKIVITLTQIKNNIIIEIKDTAGGIPDEIIQKIFDPYFSTKSEKNGTGLGLYMSKKIIEERLQGNLMVYNEKEGAVFVIQLPLSNVQEES